jgi:hypothetical protein
MRSSSGSKVHELPYIQQLPLLVPKQIERSGYIYGSKLQAVNSFYRELHLPPFDRREIQISQPQQLVAIRNRRPDLATSRPNAAAPAPRPHSSRAAAT